jgi:hypothetical protein
MLDAFLPRSGSAFVFVLTMACYGWAITSLLGATVGVLHFSPRPPNFWESHGDPVAHVIEALLFAPLLESCILIGAVELLRWLRSPGWLQVLFATVVVAGPHSFEWAPYAFVVAPGFAIQAASYLYWRALSRLHGFVVVVCIHALYNLIPAMSTVAHATRPA